MSKAKLVLTDSGGLQEETTALGIPCITLRENTERPITVTEGTNTIVGCDPTLIKTTALDALKSGGKSGRIPDLWDGKTAKRIADVLIKYIDEMVVDESLHVLANSPPDVNGYAVEHIKY